METHIKIRMDILIEAPLRKRLSALLDQHDVSGYTIFPALGGSGTDGNWSRIGQITGSFDRFLDDFEIHVREQLDQIAGKMCRTDFTDHFSSKQSAVYRF